MYIYIYIYIALKTAPRDLPRRELRLRLVTELGGGRHLEEVIKEVYESNFGTAYETYKDAVKKDRPLSVVFCATQVRTLPIPVVVDERRLPINRYCFSTVAEITAHYGIRRGDTLPKASYGAERIVRASLVWHLAVELSFMYLI